MKESFEPSAPRKPEMKEKLLLSRFEDESRSKLLNASVEKWALSLVKRLRTQSELPTSGVNVQFSKAFKEEYLANKIRLASVFWAAKNFMQTQPDFTRDEFIEAVPLRNFKPKERGEILAQVDQHLGEVDSAKKLEAELKDGQGLFYALTGKKAKEKIQMARWGATFVMELEPKSYKTLCLADEENLQEAEEFARDTNGFFQPDQPINLPGNKEENISLIAIRSDVKHYDPSYQLWELKDEYRKGYDEMMWERFKKEYPDLDDSQSESLQRTFEDWLETTQNKEGGFDIWLEKQAKGTHVGERILDWPNLDDDKYEAFQDHLKTVVHEKQHALDARLSVRKEGPPKKEVLASRDAVARYFEEIYLDYLDALRDEVLAFVETENSFTLQTVKVKKTGEKRVGGIYFYPRYFQKKVLAEVKKKIGSKNYELWGIEELWKVRVAERYRGMMVRFANISEFLFRQSSDRLNALFEIEPPQGWLRLYRWLNNDPELLKKVLA